MIGNKIDFIGDIHGHADKLEWLLSKLGYQKNGANYDHPERQVVFVGDYIDRGPDNMRVVDIVRGMVEIGSAKALMGNHEYNAIMFNTLGENGYLRPHKIKNYKQHSETLLQYNGKQLEYDKVISWFKTLPFFIETDGFRAMHACWDANTITSLQRICPTGILSDAQLKASAVKDSEMYNLVEITCKGMEVKLPDGVSFKDKDGTERHHIRIKWWQNPEGKTFEQMSVIEGIKMPETNFKEPLMHYDEKQKPVFFGHYWLKGTPTLLETNVCCLDYSVAKGGVLTAYRWDGEQVLDNNKLVYV